jgi:hypothetical protein
VVTLEVGVMTPPVPVDPSVPPFLSPVKRVVVAVALKKVL